MEIDNSNLPSYFSISIIIKKVIVMICIIDTFLEFSKDF